jgi:hypothetical protein
MEQKVKLLVEKYLGNDDIIFENKKDATDKLVKVIQSITSEKHVDMAVNYIHRYVGKYGEMSFFGDVYALLFNHTYDKSYKMIQKYMDMLYNKLEKLEHEGKISKGFSQKLKKELNV